MPFSPDTKILSIEGIKDISEVAVDLNVLDSQGNLNKVTDIHHSTEEVLKVKIAGLPEFSTNAEQLFYAKRAIGKATRASVAPKIIEKPKWIKASELTTNHYVGYFVNDDYIFIDGEELSKVKKILKDKHHLWLPVQTLTKTNETMEMIDLSVDNTNSYTANGAIVHKSNYAK